MAATSKAELVTLAEKEFTTLRQVLDGIDAETAATPHPDDGITIKDTVVHRAHWIALFLGWYRDGAAGKPVQTPAPGYKWNQLKAYNARLRDQTRAVTWDQATARMKREGGVKSPGSPIMPLPPPRGAKSISSIFLVGRATEERLM